MCKNAIQHAGVSTIVSPTPEQRFHKMQNSVIPQKPTSYENTPLDTESFAMDEHQESPIDTINATTKMRHLEVQT